MKRKAFRRPSDPVSKAKELEHEAETGRSARTPLILLGEVWVVCAIAVVLLLAVAMIAYWLAT